MDFFYGLNPLIHDKNVVDILYHAQKYMIKPLEIACVQFILDNATVAKDFDGLVTVLAQLYARGLRGKEGEHSRAQNKTKQTKNTRIEKFDWIVDKSGLFESAHIVNLLHSDMFLFLPRDIIIKIISSDLIPVKEEFVWELCVQWAKHQTRLNTGQFNPSEVFKTQSLNLQNLNVIEKGEEEEESKDSSGSEGDIGEDSLHKLRRDKLGRIAPSAFQSSLASASTSQLHVRESSHMGSFFFKTRDKTNKQKSSALVHAYVCSKRMSPY